jgi:hypothetical protein
LVIAVTGSLASCSLIIDPDLEDLKLYEPEPPDADGSMPPEGAPNDEHSKPPDGGVADAAEGGTDALDERDVEERDVEVRDVEVRDVDAAETGAPDAQGAGLTAIGGFVSSYIGHGSPSTYEIQGQMVSTNRVRGTTKSGLSIEGWFQ